jgi:DnaD and phage-associated domain
MESFVLKNRLSNTSIMIESDFIDKYMAKANGEYVKVYLLLLRYLNHSTTSLSVSEMADSLDITEKDVVRALKYWKREGLLVLNCDAKGTICGLEMGRVATDLEEAPPIHDIQTFRNRKEELKQLIFVAEQYLGKTLSKTDIDAITYFLDTLDFSVDLIDYLIEYCVEHNHKNMHYIQRVALSWAEQNITTVLEAKASTDLYNQDFYKILNAFGIRGRAAATVEVEYMKRWINEYKLSLDLIVEACNRTMAKIHQPNFEYTDVILKDWCSKNVQKSEDILALDMQYKDNASKKKTANRKVAPKNKLHNFEGRTYDVADLERRLYDNV